MEKRIVILHEWCDFIFHIESIERQMAFIKAITDFGDEVKEPEGLTADEKEYFEKNVRPCLVWQRKKKLKVTPKEMDEYLCNSKGQ